MGHYPGKVSEVRLDANRQMEYFVTCTAKAIPRAGQYLMASVPGDPGEVLATPLFLAQISAHGFWAAPPTPVSWRPGTELDLVGPLGHGFDLPREIQRLALVALGESVRRLMPLVEPIVQVHRSITLFTDLPLPTLHSSLEAYPLATLPESLDWPDFMAIDMPLESLPALRTILGVAGSGRLAFQTQVLVTTPMPCAGLAKCGVCAVPTHRGYRLVCEDGPVLDLHTLKW